MIIWGASSDAIYYRYSNLNLIIMEYNLDGITAKSQCDNVTKVVVGVKDALQHDLDNNAYDLKEFAETNDTVDDELSIVNVELNAQIQVYGTLPAGKLKERTNIRIKRLEARKAELEKRAGTYNEERLLLIEFNNARLVAEIAEADRLLAAIAAKKATLAVW